MSNNARLQELLSAVSRASRPFKAMQDASVSLAGDITNTQAALRELDAQAGRIDGFRKTSAQLTQTGQALARAKEDTAALARQLKSTQNPTLAQVEALRAARQSAADLKAEYNGLQQSVHRQRGELAQAGINTRTLSTDERRLRANTAEKTQQLDQQREALARVTRQQDKLKAVRNRYESGKQLAARANQLGSAGVGMARAGLERTFQFIAPGLDVGKQMSGIHAQLGLDAGNSSPEDLGAAVSSAAPGAGAAGVSLRETTAMLAVLAEKGVTGSAAGAEVSAMLRTLQAPDGERSAALDKLSVRTHDGQGNMLPTENILKEISASFDRNSIDAAQQTEYLKAIFGQNASSAGLLVSAAGSGALGDKQQKLQGAQGSTALADVQQSISLGGDLSKMQSSWEGLRIDVFNKGAPVLRELTDAATGMIDKVAVWVNENPQLTQTLFSVVVGAQAFMGVLGGLGLAIGPIITGVNLVMTAAGMLGTVFSIVGGGIMTVLGALTLPIVAIGVAIAGGALLIMKYWEPISAFFSGVIEGLSVAFAPLGDVFSPVLKAFDFIAEKLSGIWQWFTDLIKPIESTQETLDSCKNAGVIFGQVLSNALTAPLRLFTSISDKVSGLLEKIGLAKKESAKIDPDVANAGALPPSADHAYIPPASTFGVSPAYTPAMMPGGRSYLDQSTSQYHINLQGDMSSGSDLPYLIRNELEKYEYDKRSRRNGSMAFDY